MSLFRKKNLSGMQSEAGHDEEGHSLNRVLTVKDLTYLGIAAVVGAGIFSTIGSAASNGGPGISLLFVITAITCGFSALCYAEFASRVPISGSAYTYAYVSFGEVIAWIIGWALILEYAIGNIVVAISWSSYLNNLLLGLGIEIPFWMTTNAEDAHKAYETAQQIVLAKAEGDLAGAQKIIAGFKDAPVLLGKSIFMNIPAFLIVGLITALAYIGIKESKKSANFMVVFKVAVIILIIIVGFFYVKPENWIPFMPNGFTGVLAGVSAVFYAYIGFDAISTTAEECKNPQRDLPRGMIYALLICTVLYILIALVLTGMVNYSELDVPDPLAYVFDRINLNWIGYIISISAVIATTSVMLVFQLGQPRIWMSMSRDGLLPKAFGRIHKKYHTPAFATIVTGILVAVPTLFLPGSLVTDLTSIGTLFAFVLVCAGVLTLPRVAGEPGKFKLPYINGQIIIPAIVSGFIFLSETRIEEAIINIGSESYQEILFLVFVFIAIIAALFSAAKKYSVIPVLGALSCLYLMIEIPPVSWFWFFVWMGGGLIIYFLYGYKRSKLGQTKQVSA
ncbi:MAG: amino acid permease [Chitinophagaceae bacterium]|nr:amino acid permease [Chitinophagaceae bacterium]